MGSQQTPPTPGPGVLVLVLVKVVVPVFLLTINPVHVLAAVVRLNTKEICGSTE